MKFSRQEMDVLADLVMDELCGHPKTHWPEQRTVEAVMADAIAGTGWTLPEFEAICRRRWNGPDWVQ